MRQLDLFGAVEETKPEGGSATVADGDLLARSGEIENAAEEKPRAEEIEKENGVGEEKISVESIVVQEEAVSKERKDDAQEEVHSTTIEPEEKPVELKAKREITKQESKESKRGRKSYKEMEAEAENVQLPDDEILFQKQYYTISEVAEWFKVNTSLIRYWENEFDILKPRKTRKGDRLFRPEDVKNINLIYFLLRQRKFSIEGAKQYLKENKSKADAQMVLIQSLTKFRSFLLEWKAILGA
jgi:DNA-binding transcriptional MerR regulator